MTVCLACEVLEGRIQPPGGVVYEDDNWVVDHSISPVRLKGWLIIKPRRHVEDLAELSPAEAGSIGPLASAASLAVREGLGAERVYICSFGEEWRHVHVHVVPRYPGMEPVSWQLLGLMWSDESPWACTDQEAEAAVEAVRRAWP